MQKKHMERCLFTLLVLLIFALTILGLYRVTKHSAAPASTTIPVVSPAASPADVPTATSSPTPKPSPTPAPPDRVDSYAVQGIEVASHQSDTMHWRIERIEQEGAVCYLTKSICLTPARRFAKPPRIGSVTSSILSTWRRKFPTRRCSSTAAATSAPPFLKSRQITPAAARITTIRRWAASPSRTGSCSAA